MALDLFKKVETRKGLFAVEKVTLIYDLLTSILILFLFQEMDHPVRMLVDRAMIAGMTFLLMYLYRLAPCKFSAFVRVAIQMSCFLIGIRTRSSSTVCFRISTMSLLRRSSGCLAGNRRYGSVFICRISG